MCCFTVAVCAVGDDMHLSEQIRMDAAVTTDIVKNMLEFLPCTLEIAKPIYSWLHCSY